MPSSALSLLQGIAKNLPNDPDLRKAVNAEDIDAALSELESILENPARSKKVKKIATVGLISARQARRFDRKIAELGGTTS